MNLKKLTIVIMILWMPTAAISQENPTCDKVLEKCAKTVKEQKEALEAQEKVVNNQDELIKEQKKEVKRLRKKSDFRTAVGVVTNVVMFLLILL